MEPEMISKIAQVLAAGGPFSLLVVLGWAFWRSNERKDAELRSVYNRLIAITEAQTGALVKVEAALTSLKEAIERIGK